MFLREQRNILNITSYGRQQCDKYAFDSSHSPIPAFHRTAVVSSTCIMAACAVAIRFAQPIESRMMMRVAILSATMMARIQCAETRGTRARRMETCSAGLRP
jgi:hypothetical protein